MILTERFERILASNGFEYDRSYENKKKEWWQEITGYEPEKTPPFAMVVPIKDEENSINDIVDCLLAQAIPSLVPRMIILVTNGSEDLSPTVIFNIQTELAKRAAKIKYKTEYKWHEFLEYSSFPWRDDLLPVRAFSDELENVTIIHVYCPYAGKNNALNIARSIAEIQNIQYMCCFDADSYYPPDAAPQLYGALVNQDGYSVAAGVAINYFDRITPWSLIQRAARKTRSALGQYPVSVESFHIWGGLFALDLIEQPPFPTDIMYEDRYLTMQCRKHGGFVIARKAFGIRRLPTAYRDIIRFAARGLIHDKQLHKLHEDILPRDYRPFLDLTLREVLLRYLDETSNFPINLKIHRALGTFQRFLLRILAEKELKNILHNVVDISKLTTFDTLRSTKDKPKYQ